MLKNLKTLVAMMCCFGVLVSIVGCGSELLKPQVSISIEIRPSDRKILLGEVTEFLLINNFVTHSSFVFYDKSGNDGVSVDFSTQKMYERTVISIGNIRDVSHFHIIFYEQPDTDWTSLTESLVSLLSPKWPVQVTYPDS